MFSLNLPKIKNKHSKSGIKLLVHDHKEVIDQKEICDVLNRQFHLVFREDCPSDVEYLQDKAMNDMVLNSVSRKDYFSEPISIQEDLKWTTQVDFCVGKASNFSHLNAELMKIIYTAFVRPHLQNSPAYDDKNRLDGSARTFRSAGKDAKVGRLVRSDGSDVLGCQSSRWPTGRIAGVTFLLEPLKSKLGSINGD
ncbi:hypothetical protein BpHYR1_048246 [Brachionus plicatilis]|uniref:Uncharacterized protein n=1 Tax=Brachionus plicatilis TaxID=10195 RepID=A0A3M7PA58_BRAPC|nr:hypothetical protein BpHYR1_048246 [Brachionus plicatilis]